MQSRPRRSRTDAIASHPAGTPRGSRSVLGADAPHGTARLPTGTVTFLFTDIEGSTIAWIRSPEAMRTALVRHDALIETLVTGHLGQLVRPRGEGDSPFAVL